MKILIFGASGMVGQGVLRECLAAHDVEKVTVVVRAPQIPEHAKLQQLVVPDLMNLEQYAHELQAFDACFFCLGVSSSGMTEEAYRKVTLDLTVNAAALLARLNPAMTFIYVSGAGTDSSEQGRSMWARVKGKTENELKKLPFQAVYLFRPALIQPLHGIKSKTPSYRMLYTILSPFLTLIRHVIPDAIVTTEDIGKAMLTAARRAEGRLVVDPKGIKQLAGVETAPQPKK